VASKQLLLIAQQSYMSLKHDKKATLNTPSSLSAAGVRPLSAFGNMGSLLGFTSAAAAAADELVLPQLPFVLPQLPQPPSVSQGPAGAAAAAAEPPALLPLLPQSHGRPLLGHTMPLLPLLPLRCPLLPLPLSAAVAAAMPFAAAMASAV
jgi:hypothetical protein